MADLPALEFEVRRTENDVVVMPSGDLDMATADELAAQGISQIDQAPGMVTVDMRHVTFCDSAGINALVRIRNECGRASVRFRIVRPHPNVRVLLEITGVLGFLNVESPDADG